MPLAVHEPGGIAVGIGVAASEGEGDGLGAEDADALSCEDGDSEADGLALADGDAPAHPLTPNSSAAMATVARNRWVAPLCDRAMAALSVVPMRQDYGAG